MCLTYLTFSLKLGKTKAPESISNAGFHRAVAFF